MKKIILFIAILLGLSSVPLLAQGPNMSRYITLSVVRGKAIKLDFRATNNGTPIRVVSGDNTQNFDIGTGWLDGSYISNFTVIANSETMTIYGDVYDFSCSHNADNVTSIDVKNNKQLNSLYCSNNKLSELDLRFNKELTTLVCSNNELKFLDLNNNGKLNYLRCYNNMFSTKDINNIYCALPTIIGTSGKCYALNTTNDNNHYAVASATSNNARNKNWEVLYWNNQQEVQNPIPNGGSYACPLPANMDKYITLSVTNGKAIKLDFRAANENTTIRIVSGSNTSDIVIGTTWYDGNFSSSFSAMSNANTMTVYGDIVGFSCADNNGNISNIDLSKNKDLEEVKCYNNKLASLDLSNNPALTQLHCYNNTISNLDISNNPELTELQCFSNQLETLNTNFNTKLKELYCFYNNITELNTSNNKLLEKLYCDGNKLTSLDLKHNANLSLLYCYNNLFTTDAVNKLYCSLPSRLNSTPGKCFALNTPNDKNHDAVFAATSNNARDKNWEVKYQSTMEEIQNNGNYNCFVPPGPNMDRYITVYATRGKNIKLDFKGKNQNTPIRIISGNNTQDLNLDTTWYDGNISSNFTFACADDSIRVYGDLKGFSCSNNGDNVKKVNIQYNIALEDLKCWGNNIDELLVKNNVSLRTLHCYSNNLTSLELDNINLEYLDCHNNRINTITYKLNNKLEYIDCSDNNLSETINIEASNLTHLNCANNEITNLKISYAEKLEYLNCSNNPLTTRSVNKIYCVLPSRNNNTPGKCYTMNSVNDANYAQIVEATSDNARNKNWEVKYLSNAQDIPSNGTFVCPVELNLNKFITLQVNKNLPIKLNFKAFENNTPVRIVSGNNTENITVGTEWYNNTFVFTSRENTITIYGDVSGFKCNQNLVNVTGVNISNNPDLRELDCSFNNNIKSIDLSNNSKLTHLNCGNTQIKSLNLNYTPVLEELNCSNNNFTELNINSNKLLKKLICNNNELTSLELSQNTKLEEVHCFGNPFNTEVMNNIYCSLPARSENNKGVIFPILSNITPNQDQIKAATSENARKKNWEVKYYNMGVNQTDIKSNGYYNCPTAIPAVNMDRYITLTVKKGKAIEFGIYTDAATNEAEVKVINGKDTLDLIVGRTATIGDYSIMPNENTITIYGDVGGILCPQNGENLTDIDVSNNKLLIDIWCYDNGITSLDLSGCKLLRELKCQNNRITSLNINGCKKLFNLYCDNNLISSLDLSTNSELYYLFCENNKLTSLDLNANDNLYQVKCYGNPFTTEAMNELYCSLPPATDTKYLFPLANKEDVNHATIVAATSQNARDKGWRVNYNSPWELPIPSNGSYVCPKDTVNSNRYITLIVKDGKTINLDIKTAKAGTPVRIKSGKNSQDLMVGRYWFSESKKSYTFTAFNDTIRIYGNVTALNCSNNAKNLTQIDLSKNNRLVELYCDNNDISSLNLGKSTRLVRLSCNNNNIPTLDLSNNIRLKYVSFYNNPFNSVEVNELYCSLPDIADTVGVCYALNTEADANHDEVIAASSDNARGKNWLVKFYNNGNTTKDIPNSGAYTCSLAPLDTTKVITLNVVKGKDIKMDFRAARNRIPVKIVSGDNVKNIIIGTNWYDGDNSSNFTFTAEREIITIYGAVNAFACNTNGNNLTGINLSKNTQINELYCSDNSLTKLDLTNNSVLKKVWCENNQITNLDLTGNPILAVAVCSNNKLTTLNLSNNVLLEQLSCANNKIEILDLRNNIELVKLNCNNNEIGYLSLSKNKKLEGISCAFNKLASLDLRYNPQLNYIVCYNNPFTTEEVNKLYCSLPIVKGTAGVCYPLNNTSYSYHITATEAATSQNAVAKNWQVKYWNNGLDIQNSGSYNCGSNVDDSISSGISVYPNPASAKVQIELDADVNETLILVDLSGRALLTADVVSGKANIDVSNITAGTYFIKVGNRVQKLTVK